MRREEMIRCLDVVVRQLKSDGLPSTRSISMDLVAETLIRWDGCGGGESIDGTDPGLLAWETCEFISQQGHERRPVICRKLVLRIVRANEAVVARLHIDEARSTGTPPEDPTSALNWITGNLSFAPSGLLLRELCRVQESCADIDLSRVHECRARVLWTIGQRPKALREVRRAIITERQLGLDYRPRLCALLAEWQVAVGETERATRTVSRALCSIRRILDGSRLDHPWLWRHALRSGERYNLNIEALDDDCRLLTVVIGKLTRRESCQVADVRRALTDLRQRVQGMMRETHSPHPAI